MVLMASGPSTWLGSNSQGCYFEERESSPAFHQIINESFKGERMAFKSLSLHLLEQSCSASL